MGFIISTFFILILIIGARLLSKFFFRAARHLEEKELKEEKYRRDLLNSVTDIRNSAVPEEETISYKNKLLEANKEWLEKEKVREAIEKELGVDMDI